MEAFARLSDSLEKEYLVKDPIKLVMEHSDGYFFLPVFYSLCKHLEKDSNWMVDHLYNLLDEKFHPLLNKIRAFDPKIIREISSRMTVDTIHYCVEIFSLQLTEETYHPHLVSVTTFEQLLSLVTKIQERHCPIRLFKNSLGKPTKYFFINGTWWEEDKSRSQYFYIWDLIKRYYFESGAGPNRELVEKFSGVVPLKSVQEFDKQKWLIGLENGVLDLLTGHFGGNVPEFYLSPRKLNISQMICLSNMETLYDKLTEKDFFVKYLHDLGEKDNFFDALRDLVPEATSPISQSMMCFFIHLCKWTSFDYDLLMYMMDILASVFVGTNYEEKYFVFIGCASTGKSTLLRLMGRMLGGYYQEFLRDRLGFTADFVSTHFSNRMVVEEACEDEEMLKQITSVTSGMAKFFGTSNSIIFEKRATCIPFITKFGKDAPEKISQQLKMRLCSREGDIEDCFEGCFLMLFYHLKKHMSLKDGLLHYREAPKIVKVCN